MATRRPGWPGLAIVVVLVLTGVSAALFLRGKSAGTAAPLAAAPPATGEPTGATLDPTPTAPPSVPASAAPSGPPGASPSPTRAAPPVRFTTRPPGTALPSGAQCAAWVRAKHLPENKGANKRANQTTGHSIGGSFFTGDDPRANSRIAPRVDGQFTGTTREILRWAACKWGVDEDLVMAQAVIESWWLQGNLGDWTSDASRCAPGRGLGVDGRPGQCPESFGILQNRYPYEKAGWPGIASSTAMNADLGYAIWRTCFEGYEGWLNQVERGRDYAAGDLWGCVGRWFSGRWHVPEGETYVGRVRDYVNQRIWETANFQQP
jgi:hypothetical protein